MKHLVISMLLLAAVYTAQSQQGDPLSLRSTIIESVPAGAEVWRADSLLGHTPLRFTGLEKDTLILYYPGRSVWRARRTALPPPRLDAQQGINRVVLTERYWVNSEPPDAAVFCGDSLIGRTPLEFENCETALIRVTKPGYRELRGIAPGEDGSVRVILDPLPGVVPQPPIRDAASFRSPGTSVLAAAGLGLAAGTASVILKRSADRHYDDYRRSGDNAALRATRRDDLWAGICLVALEASVGYLVFLLFHDR